MLEDEVQPDLEDDEELEAEGSLVEVIVRHGQEHSEYTVRVSPESSLHNVKLALAAELRRPEIVKEANFVTALPNGMTVPISDAQKLGTRRMLLLEGSSLTAKEEERPPRNLADFDEFDPYEEIQSPRSLQACALEGISSEDLIYCPVEAYASAGDVSPRRSQLRHDFFEALRQDQLAASRHIRELLIWSESHELEVDAMSLDKMLGMDINSLGGLPQAQYPEVLQFFQARGKIAEESQHLGAKASSSPDPMHVWGSRWSPKVPELQKQLLPIDKMGKVEFRGHERGRHCKPSERLDKLADRNDELRDQLRTVKVETANNLAELKSLPASKKHAHSQFLNTEARALTQSFRDSQAFYQRHDELVRLVQLRNKATAEKVVFCDKEIGYAEWLRGMVEKRSLRSLAADSDKHHVRYETNMKRSYGEHSRRCNLHREQLAWEAYRKEEADTTTRTDLERAAHVHEVKNLATARYARTWARRRIRLELGRRQVSEGWVRWKAETSENLAKKDGYTRDQKYLQLKIHGYRLELKALRDAFRELAAERERRKIERRRVLRPPRIAEQRATRSVKSSYSSSDQEQSLPFLSSNSRSRSSPFHSISSGGLRSQVLSTKEPKFNFPRMPSMAMASVSTASTITEAHLGSSSSKNLQYRPSATPV
mmetsp:Transcript_55013/g.128674  ORF Transcript_55013/g.128674 Transcript_55013/m.128674 type:complete len:655 (-) Transcript_55013:136-2100(-)